jgi:TPR repeat protein
LGDPNGVILDDGVYVDLLECAAMNPETGTGEGSEAAESAFELGVYFSGRSEGSKAVFWWAWAFELELWEGAVAVGRCFLDGKGVGRDPLAAARWFMRVSEIKSEATSTRLFSDEWVPVEPGSGWVRNAALLAEIANLLSVEEVSMLSSITQGAVERLLVRTATHYVPKLSELDDDDFAE